MYSPSQLLTWGLRSSNQHAPTADQFQDSVVQHTTHRNTRRPPCAASVGIHCVGTRAVLLHAGVSSSMPSSSAAMCKSGYRRLSCVGMLAFQSTSRLTVEHSCCTMALPQGVRCCRRRIRSGCYCRSRMSPPPLSCRLARFSQPLLPDARIPQRISSLPPLIWQESV